MNVEQEIIFDLDFNEFDSEGNVKIFNPVSYLIQLIHNCENEIEMNFSGMEDDLKSVVAEGFLEAELRQINFKTRINDSGNLVWLAPGHEGRGGEDVLKMTNLTVERYRKMASESDDKNEQNKFLAMAERYEWEGQQAELIIEALESSRKDELVLAVLPDNEIVYPVTKINYLTAYRLENNEIVAYPLMNRYSNRLLSELFGGDSLSEEELIKRVIEIDVVDDPMDVFLEIDNLVTDEERDLGLVGTIIDRTKEVEDCKEVIESGREFLEKIIRYEYSNLLKDNEWDSIANRLETAWELVAKNIVGFVRGEKYLSKEELLQKVNWYISEVAIGFERQRFLREIIKENDLQILAQPLVAIGACGSLGFGAIGEVPVGVSLSDWKRGYCVNPSCSHKHEEVMVGACSICADCEKVL